MNYQELFPFPQERCEEADISLAHTVHQWGEAELASKRLELKEDYSRLIEPAMRKLLVDIGLQKILWPESFGGSAQNAPEIALPLTLALEQIGWADVGIGYVFASTFALCTTFAMEGNVQEKLVQAYAPLFCQSGQPVIGALILPSLKGKDSQDGPSFRGKALQARANQDKQAWTIEGRNMRPFNSGSNAQLFGVLCGIDGESDPAFFVVSGDAAGIKRKDVFLKTGLAASLNSDVDFDKVIVPPENLVFRGLQPFRAMLSWLYLGISATTVGSLFAAYDILKEWGDNRVIKGRGQVFKENPLTAALMAEIAMDILTSRMLLYQLAQMLAQPEVYGGAGEEKVFIPALCLATYITHAGEKAINSTMELMASAGYAKEWQLERYWRDVKTLQIHLGNRELNKMEIARYFYDCKNLEGGI